jgi:O-antigen/teichoic acid export membrane protein
MSKSKAVGWNIARWLGSAGIDAAGRLVALTLSTALFARVLTPDAFGLSTLVLTIVAVLAVFVGTPFEEALSQGRVIRRAHLQAALAASVLMAGGLCVLSLPISAFLAWVYAEPAFMMLLPVAMLTLFFHGGTVIAVAVARRRRQFSAISFANLVGHLVGIGLSLLLLLIDSGVWALIAMRVFIALATMALLIWQLRLWIRPIWSLAHLRGLLRFAGVSFADKLVENLSYLALANFVGALYGVGTLGYVNMAMRLIEPLRGAIIGSAHNLSFSFFARDSDAPQRLADRIAAVTAQSAWLIAPIFAGLAAISSQLVPLIAGPGWDPAIEIAVCLAIGSALAVPARLVFTALAASARPEFGLIANVSSLAVTLAALVALAPLGPVAVGAARLCGDATSTVFAIAMPPGPVPITVATRLRAFLPAWMCAGAMGAIVWFSSGYMVSATGFVSILIAIGVGLSSYVVLSMILARSIIRSITSSFFPAPARPSSPQQQ